MELYLLIGTAIAIVILAIIVKKMFNDTKKRTTQTELKNFIQQSIFSTRAAQLESTVQESGHESTDGSDPIFDEFIIGQVIPRTEDQRKNFQFACLLLLNTTDPRNKPFAYKPNCNGQPHVNSNNIFSPSRNNFHNYIVARPKREGQRPRHAEEILLDEFNDLWHSYCTKNPGQCPNGIVLYSWIMPCTECTEKLINTLSTLSLPVYIVYTISYRKETERQQKDSRKRIALSGMIIEQVEYPHRLQTK